MHVYLLESLCGLQEVNTWAVWVHLYGGLSQGCVNVVSEGLE
jgi:hypothetical protein